MPEQESVQKQDVEGEEPQGREDLPREPATVDLGSGLELDPTSGMEVTRAAPTGVIILAGPEASGKTTLLVSLYERFQEGPFAGYLFAGSRTLLGLEKRCHRARIRSGASKPDTVRTTPGQNMLHLRVREATLEEGPLDLLFTDFAGEVFRQAKDDVDECKKLFVIRRCDHFALLLDGEKLDNLATRAQVLADGLGLLRSCVEAEMLGAHSNVSIVLSKWDLVELSQDQARTGAYIESVRERMLERFSGKFRTFRFFRTAARPKAWSALPFAFGLEDVFKHWMSTNQETIPPSPSGQQSIAPLREFGKYLRRRAL